MRDFAIRGCIAYTPSPGTAIVRKNALAVCENGVCAGVFGELPEKYSGLPVDDYGDMLVTPGFTDLHLHAPQYANMGLGMDLTLLEWLETLAFPEEAKFADLGYADKIYSLFSDELKRGSTVRACVFATVHSEASALLMEKLEKTGLKTFVGRVSMDRNSPDCLREGSAADALTAEEDWLRAIAGRFSRTAPIATPRFVPSCTPELMEGLAAIADVYSLPVQSHLSETDNEVRWVRSLHPDCASYGAVYEKYGLMGAGTVMAHCVRPSETDIEILRRTGAFIAHCPASNTNLKSGMAPVRRLLSEGIRVGLGSDISGGHTTDMSEALRGAIAVSKQLERLSDGKAPALTAPEAFYLATKGGGEFFGKCGSFEPGYEFDAVVFDGGDAGLPPEKRFERLAYLGSRGWIRAKYVAGRRLFGRR